MFHAEVGGPCECAVGAVKQNLHVGDERKYSTYLATRPDGAETEAIEIVAKLTAEYSACAACPWSHLGQTRAATLSTWRARRLCRC